MLFYVLVPVVAFVAGAGARDGAAHAERRATPWRCTRSPRAGRGGRASCSRSCRRAARAPQRSLPVGADRASWSGVALAAALVGRRVACASSVRRARRLGRGDVRRRDASSRSLAGQVGARRPRGSTNLRRDHRSGGDPRARPLSAGNWAAAGRRAPDYDDPVLPLGPRSRSYGLFPLWHFLVPTPSCTSCSNVE